MSLASLSSLTKRAGSGSARQRYGSADPDPEHWNLKLFYLLCTNLFVVIGTTSQGQIFFFYIDIQYIGMNPCLLGDVLEANLVAVVLRLAARGSTVLPGSEAGRGALKTFGASLSQGEAFVLIVVFAVSLETWSVVSMD
jgi:hypothetical protein